MQVSTASLHSNHRILILRRSRAVQISANLGVIEEWIGSMELPKAVGSHFSPVRDLLNWLQVCMFTGPVGSYAKNEYSACRPSTNSPTSLQQYKR